MKNKDQTPGKDPEEIILGTIKYEDGKEETLTGANLANFLRTAGTDLPKNPDEHDIETFTFLLQLLNAIFKTDIEEPEIFDSFKNRREIRLNLRNLRQIISDFLDAYNPEELPPVDNITRFIRGEIDYMMAPRPRGYIELQKINSTGEQGIQRREVENEIKITFPGRNGIEEKKTRQLFEMAFLDKNFHGAKVGLNTRVAIPIDEIMDVLGRPNNPNNKKQFKRRLDDPQNGILDNIKNAYIEVRARSAKRKGESDDWIRTNIGQACGIVKDYAYFQFSEDYARYINTGIIKPFHKNVIRLGSRQFPLPYYVAEKMLDQYFSYANQNRTRKDSDKKGTNDILQIKTLLDYCKETLDYEYILETDPTHWKRKIKDKLERALNEIQEAGVLTWKYCGPGKKITQAKKDAADFYEWSELYITFALIPEEPEGQEQRIERRQKRIEAAKERKALEDEADKIRKRRRRKKTAKTEKG